MVYKKTKTVVETDQEREGRLMFLNTVTQSCLLGETCHAAMAREIFLETSVNR